MIHVVSGANRHLYEERLEELYRLRHDIFVDERDWRDLAKPDAREIDAYDNEDTIYCIAIEDGRIVGGHRLYPTIKPTMLGEIFPHLAAVRGIPSDIAIWEWSRYFIVKDKRDGALNYALMAAVQELCLDEGISEVSAVMETWWLPRFQQAGFDVRPLGLPALVNNEWTMAGLIEISEGALRKLRNKSGIQGPVLVRDGPRRPLIDRPDAMRIAAVGVGV